MLRIAIDSDFIDFYDHAFFPRYQAHYVWRRRTRTTMSKRHQLALLHRLGLHVPNNGTVMELYHSLKRPAEVVVYLDQYAHCGEGKVKLPIEQALEQYPDHYCAEFIPQNFSPHAVSYRYLQVGRKSFWLKYTGYYSWQSNYADRVDVQFISETLDNFKFALPYPMFAIDFVPGRVLHAIDFNTAPGLKDTGIPLGPQEIYDLVAQWYSESPAAQYSQESTTVKGGNSDGERNSTCDQNSFAARP